MPTTAQLAPIAFILLWSTGFIGARMGVPYVEPFTFLAVRFALVIAALLVIIAVSAAIARRRVWPTAGQAGHAAFVGATIHGCYLGGVFWAIAQGMPAVIAALVVCLQPILTAALAGPLLGERVAWTQWGGLALGLIGAVTVLSPALGAVAGAGGRGAIDQASIAAVVLALVAITAATLYQKRFGGGTDYLTAGLIQYSAALVLTSVLALTLETRVIVWSGELVFAMGWLVLVLSIGAVFLLMYLIQSADASRVAALFYMVPPATAVQAYVLFGEQLGPVQIMGTGLIMAGLYFAAPRRA